MGHQVRSWVLETTMPNSGGRGISKDMEEGTPVGEVDGASE
jgi:hypothetical protein